MLLHMYVIFTLRYCFLSKCTQYDPSCRRALKVYSFFNPLADDKISSWSKWKAFADNKLDFVKMMISLLDRVENNVGKGENAGYQRFLLFPQ